MIMTILYVNFVMNRHEQVERAFVHVDYVKRAYDEHVNSKIFRSYSRYNIFFLYYSMCPSFDMIFFLDIF